MKQEMRFLFFLLLLCLGLIISFAGRADAATISGGKYELVVAIDSGSAHDATMVGKIQTTMKNASKYLWSSLKEQGLFSKVVILVPDSWPDDPSYKPSAGETYAGADIYIGNAISGAYAQSGKIFMNTSLDGPTVIHEWGHGRFGLGDEYCDYVFKAGNWYQIYKTAAGWNRCTALQEIERDCDEKLQSGPPCALITNDTHGALASIMHRQANPGIVSWCDDSAEPKNKHNADVNNHQNRIHAKKSTWAVINTHADGFKYTGGSKLVYADPVFEVKKAKKSNVMLVLDVSGSMAGSPIQNSATAARSFVDKAEVGTFIGVVKFSTTSTLLKALTEITDDASRTAIKSAIPTGTENYTCIGCGLQTAQTALNGLANGRPKVIALMTDGGENEAPYISAVLPGLIADNIIVSSVGLGAYSDIALTDLSSKTGGKFYSVPSGDAQALADAFNSIGNSVSGAVPSSSLTSETLTIKPGETGTSDIIMDQTVGQRTVFTIIAGGSGIDISDLSATLTDPNGTVYDSTYSGYKADTISKLLITYTIAGTAAPGKWTATVTNKDALNTASVTVQASSSSSAGQAPITLTAKLDSSRVSYPAVVRVTASLFSSEAIIKANVLAEVKDPLGNVNTINLRDNGQGADIFPLDGVYSGFFTGYKANGRYSVQVFANNINNTAEVGAQFKDGAVQSDQNLVTAIPDTQVGAPVGIVGRLMAGGYMGYDFDRTAGAGGFDLSSYSSADLIPPGTITTLWAFSASATSLSINWIAPGDDMDNGTAASYDLRYSTDPITSGNFNTATKVTGIGAPKPAGSEEGYLLTGLTTDKVYYFAIKTLDKVPNTSELSNVYSAVPHYSYLYLPLIMK